MRGRGLRLGVAARDARRASGPPVGDRTLIGYMELLMVLAFAAGWVVLELVARRYDKPRRGDPPSESRDRDEAG